MQAEVLQGGFADAPREGAVAFRALLSAMARPGRIEQLTGATPPAPLSAAAGVVIATLLDPETPLWLAPSVDLPELRAWITFHSGAPLVAPQEAMFALGSWAEMPLADFPIGTPQYPDRSATLIVEQPALEASGATLRGPGIQDQSALNLPETEAFVRNAALFPLGLDFIFTCGSHVAALPRTTKVS